MSNPYVAVAAGAALGAIVGLLIRHFWSRSAGAERSHPRPLKGRARVKFQALLAAYAAIVSILLVVTAIVGGVASAVPYAAVLILGGVALAHAGVTRT